MAGEILNCEANSILDIFFNSSTEGIDCIETISKLSNLSDDDNYKEKEINNFEEEQVDNSEEQESPENETNEEEEQQAEEEEKEVEEEENNEIEEEIEDEAEGKEGNANTDTQNDIIKQLTCDETLVNNYKSQNEDIRSDLESELNQIEEEKDQNETQDDEKLETNSCKNEENLEENEKKVSIENETKEAEEEKESELTAETEMEESIELTENKEEEEDKEEAEEEKHFTIETKILLRSKCEDTETELETADTDTGPPKYELLELLFTPIINKAEINYVLGGYLNKCICNLLNRKTREMCEYISSHNEIIHGLIHHCACKSISEILIRFLNLQEFIPEDNLTQYVAIKISIIDMLLNSLSFPSLLNTRIAACQILCDLVDSKTLLNLFTSPHLVQTLVQISLDSCYERAGLEGEFEIEGEAEDEEGRWTTLRCALRLLITISETDRFREEIVNTEGEEDDVLIKQGFQQNVKGFEGKGGKILYPIVKGIEGLAQKLPHTQEDVNLIMQHGLQTKAFGMGRVRILEYFYAILKLEDFRIVHEFARLQIPDLLLVFDLLYFFNLMLRS